MAVKGRVRIPLTVENVLKRVSEYDIYRAYLEKDFTLGKALHSPFRKEENPSFSVIMGRDGKLHHIDYGDSHFTGDCINFVCQVFNINPSQALLKIDHDFGLGISPNTREIVKTFERMTPLVSLEAKQPSFIQVVSRKFNDKELAYWGSYHITEPILKLNNVYAVKTLYLDRKKYPLRNDLCFAYMFMVNNEPKWKIYWPEREKIEKWLSNVPFTTMSGMEKIKAGDSHVVITKAKKDEMVLSLFLDKVCSTQNESIYSINDHNLEILKQCPNSFINFDNDETGVKASQYYNQFGLGYINCPKSYKDPKGKVIKDFADLGRYYGIETVMAYFKRKGFTF